MPSILTSPNGNSIILIPRSGSHSIAMAMLQSFYPDIEITDSYHPAYFYPTSQDNGQKCVIVRNPIERFRSMVAHRNRTVEEQLENPIYGCEFCHITNYDRAFLFETQLQDCANWLGITVPLPHLDASENKPILTPEQENRVREIYAIDIELWESLMNP